MIHDLLLSTSNGNLINLASVPRKYSKFFTNQNYLKTVDDSMLLNLLYFSYFLGKYNIVRI